jgi:multidrug resistance efflux pump
MLEIMLLIYGGLVWLVMYKFKLIKPSSMSISWACIIGFVLIFGLLYLMFLWAPASSNAVVVSPTTPIVPRVKGYVTDVHAEANQEARKGDMLLQIDPVPYQEKVNSLKAQKTKIETRIVRMEKLRQKDYAAEGRLDELRLDLLDINAQLEAAQYDLESSSVRAPADGYPTFVVVRPGQYNAAMPFQPLMVFVHKERHLFASFRQLLLGSVKIGAEVEIIYDSLPGYVFTGKVAEIMPVIAEGQILAGGRSISARDIARPGQYLVRIETDIDPIELGLPVGAHAHVATYSDTAPPFEALRRMLIRIMTWKNYLPIKMY